MILWNWMNRRNQNGIKAGIAHAYHILAAIMRVKLTFARYGRLPMCETWLLLNLHTDHPFGRCLSLTCIMVASRWNTKFLDWHTGRIQAGRYVRHHCIILIIKYVIRQQCLNNLLFDTCTFRERCIIVKIKLNHVVLFTYFVKYT